MYNRSTKLAFDDLRSVEHMDMIGESLKPFEVLDE